MCEFELYKEARILADELNHLNLIDHSEAIQDAIDNGATGTEICMALRFSLKELLRDTKCSADTRLMAKKLHCKVNVILK